MSRIIKPQSSSSLRKKILQRVAHALSYAARSNSGEVVFHDVAAFVILGLEEIVNSVDQTASAWEKRDYWLKADKFRLEWIWAEHSVRLLSQALEADNWDELTIGFGELARHISDVKIPQKVMDGRPWEGAFEVWSEKSSPK